MLETLADGVGGVEGLDGAAAMEVCPDGVHVYVAGQVDDAVVVFDRNVTPGADFGKLTCQIVQSSTHRHPSPARRPTARRAGRAGARRDGESLYVAAANSNAVTALDRNADRRHRPSLDTDGRSTASGVDGLAGASSVAVSSDGGSVYATGENDDAIAVFDRAADGRSDLRREQARRRRRRRPRRPARRRGLERRPNVYVAGGADKRDRGLLPRPGTDALTFLDAVADGVDGVDGLAGISALVVTDDDVHVYASGTAEDALAAFRREPTLGGLSSGSSVAQRPDGIDRLIAPASAAPAPDGRPAGRRTRRRRRSRLLAADRFELPQRFGNGAQRPRQHRRRQPDRLHDHRRGRSGRCLPPYPCTATDLVNTASVTVPGGAEDPDAADNTDVDTDDLSPRATSRSPRPTTGRCQGLGGATAVALSPLGDHLYATGGAGDGISAFARDAGDGTLTFVES